MAVMIDDEGMEWGMKYFRRGAPQPLEQETNPRSHGLRRHYSCEMCDLA